MSVPMCSSVFPSLTVLGERLEAPGVPGIFCRGGVHVCRHFGIYRVIGETLQTRNGGARHFSSGKTQVANVVSYICITPFEGSIFFL